MVSFPELEIYSRLSIGRQCCCNSLPCTHIKETMSHHMVIIWDSSRVKKSFLKYAIFVHRVTVYINILHYSIWFLQLAYVINDTRSLLPHLVLCYQRITRCNYKSAFVTSPPPAHPIPHRPPLTPALHPTPTHLYPIAPPSLFPTKSPFFPPTLKHINSHTIWCKRIWCWISSDIISFFLTFQGLKDLEKININYCWGLNKF